MGRCCVIAIQDGLLAAGWSMAGKITVSPLTSPPSHEAKEGLVGWVCFPATHFAYLWKVLPYGCVNTCVL